MGELSNKTIVVTGATAGVGKEIARGLLQQGAHVVMIARNADKARAVVEELGRAGVSVFVGDVACVRDMKRVGKEILAQHPALFAVVHNAATIPLTRTVTSEGLEQSFAANTVSPLVLTRALLPGLVAGKPSRVVFLIGASAPLPLDDLQFERGYQGWSAYQRTKFGSLQVLRHLKDELPDGVTIHGAFPGIVKTPGMDDAVAAQPFLGKVMLTLMKPFMRTPERGARAPVWVTSAPELAQQTGKLWTWKEPLTQRLPAGWDDAKNAAILVEKIDALTQPLLA